jgi:hypothetical protein
LGRGKSREELKKLQYNIGKVFSTLQSSLALKPHKVLEMGAQNRLGAVLGRGEAAASGGKRVGGSKSEKARVFTAGERIYIGLV